jgi:hypothetical protein
MLRKSLSAFAFLSILSSPALAVTPGGSLDGNAHPYVGLMVAQTADGTPLWRCSGTLIAPQLFLTAGHCTEAPAAHVEIWFDANVDAGRPANGYPRDGQVGGTPYTHPSYNPAAFFLYDVGMVVLDEPVAMSEYGALPSLNELDAMKPRNTTRFTAVGYGVQEIHPVKPVEVRVRMVANPHLLQINTGFTGTQSILLSNNHSTGGTCFGDSGGPNFIGSSNVIGGVTSFGINGQCAGTGGVYRIDRADDLDWIYSTFGSLLP